MSDTTTNIEVEVLYPSVDSSESSESEILDSLDPSEIEDFRQYLESIDSEDTVSTLIDKLNKNFEAITNTGIFKPREITVEDEHESLCDALLIKPHPPIHRRKRVLEPLELRTDTSWLQNVDYLLGDVVIIEQRRNDNSGCNRVYMYTIAKSSEGEDIEFVNETELTGPAGKNAQLYLTYDSKEIFENTQFDTLNVTTLNVASANFVTGGSLAVSDITTNKLTIGNITFYNNGDTCELGTNILNVGTVYGFRGAEDNITFGSPIMVDYISSSSPEGYISIETGIKVNKICALPDGIDDDEDGHIFIGSTLESLGTSIDFASRIKVNELESYKTDGKIYVFSPLMVDNIGSKTLYGSVNFTDPITVDTIYSNGELSIDTPITSSKWIDVNTEIRFNKDVLLDEDTLRFTHFGYDDKFRTHGRVFLGFENLFNLEIPEYNADSYDLTKLGNPYSFVPTNGEYYIAKVTKDDNEWYMLAIKSERDSKEDDIRIVTSRTEVAGEDIQEEDVYELIASNAVYRYIYTSLKNGSTTASVTSSEKYKTIGFSKTTEFGTYLGCKIDLVNIGTLNNNYGLDDNKLIYYLTLY